MTSASYVDRTDDRFEYGHTDRFGSRGELENRTDWVRIVSSYHEKVFWFLRPPFEVFADQGRDISAENCKYFEDVFGEDVVGGYYYVMSATSGSNVVHSDRIASLIFNDVMALAKAMPNLDWVKAISPIWIGACAQSMFATRRIDRKYFQTMTRRMLTGEGWIEILSDEMYAIADTSLVDTAIEAVLAENPGKLDGSEKMLNWMVGQVMRRTQGKADASYVKEKLNDR